MRHQNYKKGNYIGKVEFICGTTLLLLSLPIFSDHVLADEKVDSNLTSQTQNNQFEQKNDESENKDELIDKKREITINSSNVSKDDKFDQQDKDFHDSLKERPDLNNVETRQTSFLSDSKSFTQKSEVNTINSQSIETSKKEIQLDKPDQVNDHVKLNVVKANGFTHPGITVIPKDLENTRQEIIKHADPWYSYYSAMSKSPYAQRNIGIRNLAKGTVDTPKDTSFTNNGQLNNLSADGFGAYTQALMYYFTADPIYRYNSMRMVRVWEKMDPTKYQHFADDHIHVGTPFYYMVSAAELLRYTTPLQSTYNNYSLVWSSTDTEQITKNLIDPTINTFLYTNTKYFNQHLYPLVGAMAGYIFTNNKKRYDEAVEWFTVNKNRNINKDTNGAISNLFHKIESSDPRNPTGKTYIQHLEMGRDQAHGAGDVMNLTGLARMIYEQGTKIDPISGEVSVKPNAVDPYQYLNDRLLDGAEQFYHYMAGYTIPWTKLGVGDYGGPTPSEAYRGRTAQYFDLSEIYDAYRYLEGMSNSKLERRAPSITHAAHNLNSPIYFKGAVPENFWGAWHDSKMTEVGCEYWLSIPLERSKDHSLDIPTSTNSSDVSFAKRGAILDERTASIKQNNGEKYIEVHAVSDKKYIKETGYDEDFPKDKTTKRGAYQISLSSLVRPDEKKFPYLGLRVKTNGSARLEIGSDNYGSNPYQIIYLPNTHNKWVYVAYNDTLTGRLKNTKRLDNMDYYRVISNDENTVVDFDTLSYLNTEYGQRKNILSFAQPELYVDCIKGVQGNIDLSKNINSNAKIKYFINSGTNAGLALNEKSGLLSYSFTTNGSRSIFVVAINQDSTVATQKIVFRIAKNRNMALKQALDSYDNKLQYTLESQANLNEQLAKVKMAKSDQEFERELNVLEQIISDLELMSPKLSDGSLNYVAYNDFVSNTQTIQKTVLPNLVDGNAQSYSGDVKAPIIFDFGSNFGISSYKFEIQARQGFPNRSQGTNVYGSNDGQTWILLTSKPTTETSDLETLNVKPDQLNKIYRFIKLQVDYPGRPNDPNYPGIASYSEFRIFGQRHEFESALTKVSIKGNGLKNRIVPGQTATLEFSSKEKIKNIRVTIDNNPVKVVEIAPDTYRAQYTLIRTVHVKPVQFSIDYDINGKPAVTQRLTTDNTSLYESSNQNEINLKDHLPTKDSKAYSVRQSSPGDVSIWFDGKVDKMYEARKDKNPYKDGYVTFDFSNQPIAIDHVEMIARQDRYSSRATSFTLRGSNGDPTNWSQWITITPRGQNSEDWQILRIDPKYKNKTFKYIQIYAHAVFLGLTELKIFGNTVSRGKILYQDENHNNIAPADQNLPSTFVDLNNSNVDIPQAPMISGYKFDRVLFNGKIITNNYFTVINGKDLVYVYQKINNVQPTQPSTPIQPTSSVEPLHPLIPEESVENNFIDSSVDLGRNVIPKAEASISLDRNSIKNKNVGIPYNRVAYVLVIKHNLKNKVHLLNSQGKYVKRYIKTNQFIKVTYKKVIHHKIFYKIKGTNYWISAKHIKFVNMVKLREIIYVPPMKNRALKYINLVDENGKFSNQKIKTNSYWKIFAEKYIKGKTYYCLGNSKQWLLAKYARLV